MSFSGPSSKKSQPQIDFTSIDNTGFRALHIMLSTGNLFLVPAPGDTFNNINDTGAVVCLLGRREIHTAQISAELVLKSITVAFLPKGQNYGFLKRTRDFFSRQGLYAYHPAMAL